MHTNDPVVAILHNIRSAHNVGSMFRTADAAGITHLYLTGYTPTPLDRFGRPTKEIAKTALGGEQSVPWSTHASLRPVLSRLKNEGYRIIALERTKGAVDYRTQDYRGKVALLVGNEVRGVSPATLRSADMIIEIPMVGMKESLNVSVAFGVATFRIREAKDHGASAPAGL